jgi:4-hydroxy-tetrahydrodipicolinate synthase
MSNVKLSGSLVALITPFKDGAVDEAGLRALVEYHVKNGTNGIVPCGTTGESVTLDEQEHERVVRIVTETVAGRIPVVAGAGTNSTEKSIKLAKEAKHAGASAILVVTPYYNRPTQQGLYLHYEAIANAVDIPIVVYNVPSRTGTNLLPETLARLSKISQVVAVKEASGSMDQVSQIIRDCGPDFTVLSGDDSLTLPILALGGHGVISVVANVAPRAMSELVARYRAGKMAEARALHYQLFELCRTMFVETNPIPVKAAAGMLGLCGGELRLPMCPPSDANRAKIQAVLDHCALVQRLG